MDTSFVKLQLSDNGNKTCFLLIHQKSGGAEGFQLTLTDGEQCWEGELTEEDLDDLSSDLKMDFKTYVKQTRMALTRPQNINSEFNFAYQCKHLADGVVDFLWKKEATEDIKILMGHVSLHRKKDTAKSLSHIFDACIDSAEDLHSRIHTLEAENLRLAQERQNALKRLDKCVSAKEELERDLYAKFAAVLNSKKEKIQARQQGCGEESMDEADDVPCCTSKGPKSSIHKALHKASNDKSLSAVSNPRFCSEDEEAVNTDDETFVQTPPRKKIVPADLASEDADTSLVLGDEDDGDMQEKEKRVVRPARSRGGNKLAQARAVLPKVSSCSSDGRKSTGTSRRSMCAGRSSMRKSGSGQSDQSGGDNLDTDDLLNDF